MRLRPSSPVQLVTRALRSIPPAYQTAVWHAGSFHYTVATFGTHRAAAFATGTDYARSSGTGVPICEPVESTGMQSAIPATGQPSENLDHRSASYCVDDRLSSRPALWSLVILLGMQRHAQRSSRHRSAIIDYWSIILDSLSVIIDTLSILIDKGAFCGSVIPGNQQFGRADDHRLCRCELLSSSTRRKSEGGRQMYPAAPPISPDDVSHGLVQRHSVDAIQYRRNDAKGAGRNRRRVTANYQRNRGQQGFAFLGCCVQDSSRFRLFGR